MFELDKKKLQEASPETEEDPFPEMTAELRKYEEGVPQRSPDPCSCVGELEGMKEYEHEYKYSKKAKE